VIPVVVGALGTIKMGMVENIKRVSERANVTETQNISMLGSAQTLRKVLNVCSEWMTCVSDAPYMVCTRLMNEKTPAETVIKEINNNNYYYYYYQVNSCSSVCCILLKGWVQTLVQGRNTADKFCFLSATMIKFLPLDFLGASHIILWRNENAVYRLQIAALVPEIFKFEKCLKYANGITDDVIQSAQYYIICVNRAILANLQCRSLKLGRLIVLEKTHLRL